MFKILYGDVNPFDGLAPTPLVSREVSVVHYGRRDHDVDTFVLNGVLTGQCLAPETGDLGFMWGRLNQLYNNFSKPFQKFSIVEDLGSGTGVLFSGNYAIPRSIDVDENPFATIIPFTVTLDVFDESRFSGVYGVLEPSSETRFDQDENGTVTITKTTSARAFNTDSGSLAKAIDFVKSMAGYESSVLTPLFIPASGAEDALLMSSNETINRLEGSYTLEETFMCDLYGRSLGSSLYTSKISIEAGDIGVQISIEGELTGGKNSTIEDVRANYGTLNLYAEAEQVYADFGYTGTLYPVPIRKSINEDTNEKTISFSLQFNDSIAEDPYIIDSINVQWDSETNKHCVNASVSIRSTDSCRSSKWTKVNNYYNSFDIIDWIDGRLDELGYDLTFPNKPKTESVNFDEKAATINLTASVCEKKIIVPDHFGDFNYTVQISPAMPIYVPFQGLDCGGAHTIQKLPGKTRKIVTIQGEGTILPCSSREIAEASMRDYINGVKLVYLSLDNTFLSASTVRYGTGANSKKVYFNFTWNEEDDFVFETILFDSLSAAGGVENAIFYNGTPILYNGTNIIYSA